ncbi:NAD(P)H-dependent oxidoreductase [Micromonospora sp. NBC_00898]|uniref:NAD(P)H-dependent oxidoreductase n=1 Tax=Micromonospora sp. NBC_00898 TaxID=2975981 RepID=UPI003864A358|nr:NAD(P)H-dependent oxidoreductase [Micromonospora sp. NBC_00898]
MPGTLLILAHPDLGASRINAALAAGAREADGVTVHDLYAAYPGFAIDVIHEQQLLLAHDRIVLQYPTYWYATPALLKHWLDSVLQRGFAYGGGTALRGKTLQVATTTGGPAASYQPEGHNRYTMAELLLPLHATANLCGMRFAEPLVVHGAGYLSDEDLSLATKNYREHLAREQF